MTADSFTPTRPIWVDPEATRYPRLENDLTVDVVVIGAGIAGIGCAHWLCEAGVSSVAVIESRTVCSGASGRNAGFVMAVAPENFPTTDDQDDVRRSRLVWTFTAENQRLLEQAIETHELVVDYRKLGSLGLAATFEEWNWIRESASVARDAGLSVELISREDLDTPWLRSEYFGGAWYPGNGELDPGKFVLGIASRLEGRVKVFERTSATSLRAGSDDVTVQCGAGTIRAAKAIVATNGYTPSVLPELESVIGATRGQVLATVPLGRTVATCPVYANHGFQYWRQRPDTRLVLGGWRDLDIPSEVGTDEVLHTSIQSELTKAAYGLCDGEVDIDHRWSGVMGFTPDRQPLVGPVPHRPGVSVCAGFSGHGLAMAFHSAKIAVAQLKGETTGFDGLFDPGRFIA